MEQLGDAFVGRSGLGDHPVEHRGELGQGQLVGEREGAVLGAKLRRQQELPPVGVVELADIAELVLRNHASGDPPRLLQPPPHRLRHRQWIAQRPAQRLGALLQLGIMVAVLLDIVAHPIFRRDQRARIAVAGQARVAPGFLQRGIEPGDGVGDRRRVVGQLGQLVARHVEVGEQRIGEDLGQLVGPGARPAARGEGCARRLVNVGQLEQQRRGHRPLVALEMVQIARADAEARRHVGLRHGAVAAQAAQAVAEEELGRGHDRVLSTSPKSSQVKL